MEIERENQFKADEEDVNDLFYWVFEYRNSAKFRKLLNFCLFQAASEVEKLLRPCNFKDGWLWEYTPALQDEYRRLNPLVKTKQGEFEF